MSKILREFWDSGLFEGVSPTLYHVSRFPIENLQKNELVAALFDLDFDTKTKFKKKFYFLCFARSIYSSFIKNENKIIFELDGKKLNNRFSGTPYDFYHSKKNKTNREFEDMLWLDSSTLQNLNQYLRRIIIRIDLKVPFNDLLENSELVGVVNAALDYKELHGTTVDFVDSSSHLKILEYKKYSTEFRKVKSKPVSLDSNREANEQIRLLISNFKKGWIEGLIPPNIYPILTILFLGKLEAKYLYLFDLFNEDPILGEETCYIEPIEDENLEFGILSGFIKQELIKKLKSLGAKSATPVEINKILRKNFNWKIDIEDEFWYEERPPFVVDREIEFTELVSTFSEETQKKIYELLEI